MTTARLDDSAKAAWRQVVPQLEIMKVLARIDGNALARYCQLWARWRKAELFVQKTGDVYPLARINVPVMMPVCDPEKARFFKVPLVGPR